MRLLLVSAIVLATAGLAYGQPDPRMMLMQRAWQQKVQQPAPHLALQPAARPGARTLDVASVLAAMHKQPQQKANPKSTAAKPAATAATLVGTTPLAKTAAVVKPTAGAKSSRLMQALRALRKHCASAAGRGTKACQGVLTPKPAGSLQPSTGGFFHRAIAHIQRAMRRGVDATRGTLRRLVGAERGSKAKRVPFKPVPLNVLMASPQLRGPMTPQLAAQIRWLYRDQPQMLANHPDLRLPSADLQ